MTTARPTSFEDVLEVVGFNANTRAVITDPNRENLTFADLITWTDDEVDNLIKTLRKTTQGGTTVYVRVSAVENFKTVCYTMHHYCLLYTSDAADE